MYLLLQEETTAVKAIRGCQQKKFISKIIKVRVVIFSKDNNFNTRLIFNNNSNKRIFDNNNNNLVFRINHHNFQRQQYGNSSLVLEDIVKILVTSTHTFQNETRANMKNLEQQMSHLATSMSRLESQGKLHV